WVGCGQQLWVVAMSVSVIVLVLGFARITALRPPAAVVTVLLSSSLGIEGRAVAAAPAGKRLSLQLEIGELPSSPLYRLEVVNAGGKPMWQAVVSAPAGRIASTLDKGLPAGLYFVRLHTAAGHLLRAFAL